MTSAGAIAYWNAILVAFPPPAAFQRESRSQCASTGAEWSESAPRMLDAPPMRRRHWMVASLVVVDLALASLDPHPPMCPCVVVRQHPIPCPKSSFSISTACTYQKVLSEPRLRIQLIKFILASPPARPFSLPQFTRLRRQPIHCSSSLSPSHHHQVRQSHVDTLTSYLVGAITETGILLVQPDIHSHMEWEVRYTRS